MSLPNSMSVSTLVGPGRIERRTVPTPLLRPRDLLIRVDAVGVCGSDTHFYRNGRIGDLVVGGPVVLGHETAGTVVAAGTEASADRIGRLVSIEPQRPCRHCDRCLAGDYNLCPNIEFYGAYPVDGSFAEYVSIPEDFAFDLPAGTTAEEGALLEPLSVAIYAARRAQIGPGDRLLVAGGGPVGLLVAQAAEQFGVGEVILTDPASERREAARRFTSATALEPSELNDQSEFTAFIDASGAPTAIRAGVRSLARRGRAVLVGMGMDDLELPVSFIQHSEITLTGTFRYAHTWPLAVEMLARGVLNVAPLANAGFGLDEVEAALLASSRDPSVIKAVVYPHGKPDPRAAS